MKKVLCAFLVLLSVGPFFAANGAAPSVSQAPTVTWEKTASGEFLPWGIPFSTERLRCLALMTKRSGFDPEKICEGEDGTFFLHNTGPTLWSHSISGYVIFVGGGLDSVDIFLRGEDSDYLFEAEGTQEEAQVIFSRMSGIRLRLLRRNGRRRPARRNRPEDDPRRI